VWPIDLTLFCRPPWRRLVGFKTPSAASSARAFITKPRTHPKTRRPLADAIARRLALVADPDCYLRLLGIAVEETPDINTALRGS
jgi:hypothetical protein